MNYPSINAHSSYMKAIYVNEIAFDFMSKATLEERDELEYPKLGDSLQQVYTLKKSHATKWHTLYLVRKFTARRISNIV